MEDQLQSPTQQESQSPSLTPVSDKAATLKDKDGNEYFIDETATPPKDESIIDLPDLEEGDEDLEPEEPPTDKTPEEVELGEKFTKFFSEQTGMEMEEFTETFRELRTIAKELGAKDLREGIEFIKSFREAQAVEEIRTSLDKYWGVDREETTKRIEAIKPYFNKMPPDKRKLYDTLEGADLLWRSYLAKNGDVNTMTKTTKGSKGGGKRMMFTESQIQAMDINEYRQKADEIAYAYQNNLVGAE